MYLRTMSTSQWSLKIDLSERHAVIQETLGGGCRMGGDRLQRARERATVILSSNRRTVAASGRVGSVLDAPGRVDYEYLPPSWGKEALHVGANKTYQQKGGRGRTLGESDEFRRLRQAVEGCR